MLKLISRILLVSALFLTLPLLVKATNVCEDDTTLNFVARDPGGAFIANAKVEVYKQEVDVNGADKPGARVGSATTDAILGRATIKWRNSTESSSTYAIRVRTIDKNMASFYYYGINLGCGETATTERTLSGIIVTLRKGDGTPLTNINFSIYTQLKDANGYLVSTKGELITSVNSGLAGQAKIYLPQGTLRGLDVQEDYYVLEISYANSKFYYYNINVIDGQLTSVNYNLSYLRLRLRDAADKAAVGTKVEVYKQDTDLDNQRLKGLKIGDLTIADNGYGSVELPVGMYVLGVKGSDNKYQYFWDVNIAGVGVNDRTLFLYETYVSPGFCQKNSNFNISVRSVAGVAAAGLKFELYEQVSDANGFPTAGTKISSGTISSTGWAVVNFKPDPEKSYVLKIWDKRADLGEFWFYDVAKFVCGYDRKVIKTIPALKIVLRDSQGALRRNANLALYSQQFDADNNPIIPETSLIGNLKTDSSGQVTVYVAPYNSYSSQQSGIYALTTKDAGDRTINFFNINISSEKDYSFQARITGLGGRLQDARSRAVANREIRLYEVLSDGSRRLGPQIARAKTDSNGNFSFEYPAGTYALGVNDEFNQENIFWDIKTGVNEQKLTLNLTNFSLTNGAGENLSAAPTLKLFTLSGSNSAGYFRDQEVGSIKLSPSLTALKSLTAGAYLIVYTASGNKEYGTAFYASNGMLQSVGLTISSKSLLIPKQSFQVKVGSSTGVSSEDPIKLDNSQRSTSLITRVKGRILLQVEDKGQAWYINPSDGKKYYLGRPEDAYNVMRRVGLGISNTNFAALEKNPSAWRTLAGKILLKTEDKGRAYYFDPVALKLYYLGRPSDAFNIMRTLGLGTKTNDLQQLSTGVN